jgi:hypothetical protein
MNYPTGMGLSTGHHYHNVAAQMHAYMNNPMQQNYSPIQGRFSGASQALQFGAQRMGVNPMLANDVGGFARSFMRNILS